MYEYSVFGGRLISELELPDLRTASPGGKSSWTLRVSETGSPPQATGARGELELAPGLVVRLADTATGIRLDFAPVGTVELSRDGTEITWYPAPVPSLETVRLLLLGQVFALALHGAGLLCLHGSSVAIGGRGIAFLAPKFHGKSTLALALTAAGARLITDDLVAVETEAPPRLLPGVQSVRLLKDAVQRVGALCTGTRIIEGGKATVTDFPSSMLVRGSVPFAAAYLLQQVTALPGNLAARRERLPLRESTIALAYRTKLPDPLVGYQTAGVDLQRAAAVARQIPVFRLEYARDFTRLPEVVSQILAWHRAPSRRRRDTAVAHP
jgi:hypothetical protein